LWLSHQYPTSIPATCLPIPSTLTWWRVQVTKHLITTYAIFSSLLSPHLPSVHIFSSAPCSQTPSLHIRDQVSHPYRSTNKSIGWYILMFTFLEIYLLQNINM
jgi:hypothetical protein